LAKAYVAEGSQIDWAAMCALSAAPRELDRVAVSASLRAIYMPWVEESALTLQELIRSGKVKLASTSTSQSSATTILFVDGLRMDLAKELVRRLEAEGLKIKLGWSWSGFPTVTATCKPMVSPVAALLRGPATTFDVLPLSPDGKPVTKPVLFKLMQAEGWETDNALLPASKLWAETGRFDEEGHALGARLAERLSAGIRDAADRVLQLVRMGRSVHVITDHGWLLMPGGLPLAALDVGLVEPNGNPCRDVKRMKVVSDGWYTWTLEDVAKFIKRHPKGTIPYLALCLMLFLGARRQDAIRLGPKNRRGDVMRYVPKKTSYARMEESVKPVLKPLAAAIEATAHGIDVYLLTSHGKQFTDAGFGNWMRERCDEAELPECTSHGLKKAAATICANMGATDRQMMMLFDWKSEKMANVYTAKANKEKLAADAARLLGEFFEGTSRALIENKAEVG
jgi:integrase